MGINGKYSLNVPVTRVDNARIVVNVDKHDRGVAYASVSYVVTESFMGTAMESINLSRMRFTDLEPMKRRNDKRLSRLLATCREQVEARMGPIWSLVKDVAFENRVEVATPDNLAPLEESA